MARPGPMTPVEWVATPPVPARPQRPSQPPTYSGPPSYPAVPRWGFPPVTWRRSVALPGSPLPFRGRTAVTGVTAQSMAARAVPLLRLTAVAAALATLAELWRYVLLLQSRYGALPARRVWISDALVVAGATVTVLTSVSAAVFTVLWLLRARQEASAAAGVLPSRPNWQVLVGVLCPGVNLVLAGAVVAELEHTALRLPPDRRPSPSRPLLWWWALWAVNGVVALVTFLWSFREGVQAEADGVVLHALTDASAVAVALATARTVDRITELLVPERRRALRRERVVEVRDAEPPVLRPPHPHSAR